MTHADADAIQLFANIFTTIDDAIVNIAIANIADAISNDAVDNIFSLTRRRRQQYGSCNCDTKTHYDAAHCITDKSTTNVRTPGHAPYLGRHEVLPPHPPLAAVSLR